MSEYFLGIDLHKRSSVWVLLDASKTIVQTESIVCTKQAVEEGLNKFNVDWHSVKAAIEPVCGWRWVANHLRREGLDVRIVNPFKTRLIAENRLKHDKIDATILAELLRADFLPESYWAPDEVCRLRELVRHRAYLVRLRTSVKNRIHGTFGRNGEGEEIVNPLRKSNSKKVEPLLTEELRNLFSLLNEFSKKIKPLDLEIAKEARRHSVARLLMTMPAVGPITALTIAAEVGDWERFDTPAQLTSFAGLVPRQRSSGQNVRFGRITKAGSRVLRYSIVEAALRIRDTYDIRLNSFLARLKETHGAKQARVALARKMLSIMWYMIKRNEPYKDEVSQESSVKPVIS